MDFGFASVPSIPFRECLSLIQLAENLGYSWAWIPDQTFYRDPYPILANAALSTKEINLGVGITNPYTRHPGITARAAATIDEIAGKRFVIGIGAGNQKELIAPLGLVAEAPARAIREAMEIMRGFWSGNKVHVDGKDFQAIDVHLEFPSRPDIPIYIGGRGPQILNLAGREANGIIFSLSGLDHALELVSDGINQAGRKQTDVDKVAWGECVITDANVDIEIYRQNVAHVLGRSPIKGLRVMGFSEEEITQISKDYEEGGAKAVLKHVSDDILKRQLILGAAEECAQQLVDLSLKGIKTFVYLIKEATFEGKSLALENFAKLVIPKTGFVK